LQKLISHNQLKYNFKAFIITIKIWFKFYIKKLVFFRNRSKGIKNIHFLHVGKTGGAAIKNTLNNYITSQYCFFGHHHIIKLKHISNKDKVIFSVRDPIERFISAFYFAKDRSKFIGKFFSPKACYYLDHFDTADDLAIALYSKLYKERIIAQQTMLLVPHLKENYWYWFKNKDYLQKRLTSILYVFSCKNLNNDFLKFRDFINADSTLELPQKKDIKANVNFNKHNKTISNEGIENLKKWLTKDFEFLQYLMEEQLIEKV